MSAVSVVVPTFDEASNAEELLHRLHEALRGRVAEVIFVDDGSDDLPEVVARTATQLDLPVRVIRRAVPIGRLGGAVAHGISQSNHDLVVVCDGDLQHPPELVPQLVDALGEHDLAVASRYIAGGAANGLDSSIRRIVSRSTGMLSKAVFPLRLRGCSDPMSGFFALRRSAVDITVLRPQGFKILLEIVARSAPLQLIEVPFVFGRRTAGESHATFREGALFVRQLVGLRVASSRALLFMLVGASGVIPNLVVLDLLTSSGLHYLWASFLAVQVGVLWNSAGAELFVWRDRKVGRLRHRFARYLVVGETDLLRLPFVVLLVVGVGMSSLSATVLTIMVAFLLRFSLADKIVYRRAQPHISVSETPLNTPVLDTIEKAA